MKASPEMRAFLTELEALCRKHNASIDGCGCCGSPGVTIGNEELDRVVVSRRGSSDNGYKNRTELTLTVDCDPPKWENLV